MQIPSHIVVLFVPIGVCVILRANDLLLTLPETEFLTDFSCILKEGLYFLRLWKYSFKGPRKGPRMVYSVHLLYGPNGSGIESRCKQDFLHPPICTVGTVCFPASVKFKEII